MGGIKLASKEANGVGELGNFLSSNCYVQIFYH